MWDRNHGVKRELAHRRWQHWGRGGRGESPRAWETRCWPSLPRSASTGFPWQQLMRLVRRLYGEEHLHTCRRRPRPGCSSAGPPPSAAFAAPPWNSPVPVQPSATWCGSPPPCPELRRRPSESAAIRWIHSNISRTTVIVDRDNCFDLLCNYIFTVTFCVNLSTTST